MTHMHASTPSQPFHSGDELAAYYIRHNLDQHPFLGKEKNYDLTHLWALMTIGKSFKENETYWVTHFVSRTKDNRVRSHLIQDLNDDLGHGDATKSHTLIYENLIKILQPWSLPDKIDVIQQEDQCLSESIGELRTHNDFYIAFGATLGSSIFTNAIIKYMVKTLTLHKDKLPPFDWFHSHMSETHHDKGMAEIAHYIPNDAMILEKVAQGDEGVRQALWHMLDVLNSL